MLSLFQQKQSQCPQKIITIGGETFYGVRSCEVWLLTNVPEHIKGSFSLDWIGLCHYAGKADDCATIESIMARDHHASKGGFSQVISAAMYASMHVDGQTMCLAWHTKGQCNSDCPRVVDHVSYTASDYKPLHDWCVARNVLSPSISRNFS